MTLCGRIEVSTARRRKAALKRFVILVVAVLACAVPMALPAQPSGGGRLGLGVMLGEPTGLSAKVWLGGISAVDGGVAWSFVHNPAVSVHVDYLFHFFDVIPVKEGRLPLYVGIGGVLSASQDPDLGVRIPVGVTYLFASAPLDLFLEVAPILLLFPATTFDFSGGVGIRFYFPRGGRASKK
jgi:hypothetical protein